MLSLLLALATSPSPALAADSFEGTDSRGGKCVVSIVDERGQPDLTLQTSQYTFTGIPLAASDEGYTYRVLTIDRGGSTYSPPIGAPITFGNIGLVTVSGKVLVSNGQVREVQMKAVGGLANWWRASYRCVRR